MSKAATCIKSDSLRPIVTFFKSLNYEGSDLMLILGDSKNIESARSTSDIFTFEHVFKMRATFIHLTKYYFTGNVLEVYQYLKKYQ